MFTLSILLSHHSVFLAPHQLNLLDLPFLLLGDQVSIHRRLRTDRHRNFFSFHKLSDGIEVNVPIWEEVPSLVIKNVGRVANCLVTRVQWTHRAVIEVIPLPSQWVHCICCVMTK